jgi:hypothetical protein
VKISRHQKGKVCRNTCMKPFQILPPAKI